MLDGLAGGSECKDGSVPHLSGRNGGNLRKGEGTSILVIRTNRKKQYEKNVYGSSFPKIVHESSHFTQMGIMEQLKPSPQIESNQLCNQQTRFKLSHTSGCF